MTPLQIEALRCLREWESRSTAADALGDERQRAGTLYDPSSGKLCREYIEACNAEFGARLALRAVARGLVAMDDLGEGHEVAP